MAESKKEKTTKAAASKAKPKTTDAKKKPAAKKDAAPAKAKTAPKKSKSVAGTRPRLKTFYHEKVIQALIAKLGYSNVWQVPRMEKIVLNMGLGNAREDAKVLKGALEDLSTITGQKPVVTYAKKPISNFKIRLKDPVGAKVTLRKNHMWEFFDRLMALTIPRVRDFRGLPNRSFDGRGNYTFGITEQIVFPEIDYDKIDQIRGMDITIVTSANTDEEAYELMAAFGFPFKPKSESQQEGAAA